MGDTTRIAMIDFVRTMELLEAIQDFYERSKQRAESYPVKMMFDKKEICHVTAVPVSYRGSYTAENFLVSQENLFMKIRGEYVLIDLLAINYSWRGYDEGLINLWCRVDDSAGLLWTKHSSGLKFVCSVYSKRFADTFKNS